MCFALLPDRYDDLSPVEQRLFCATQAIGKRTDTGLIAALRQMIQSGADPLGEAFILLRSQQEYRSSGTIYTPMPIVRAMIDWLATQGDVARIIDPGSGSGRFIVTAGLKFPDAQLIAIEKDPLAALTVRANLNVHQAFERAKIFVRDYRQITLPTCDGVTAFIGNPPYVRHHDIGKNWKNWYTGQFSRLGIKASALAGLHLHFFLKTHLLARKGDVGAFITSAEWMDVNYGSALRELLLNELGGIALHVLEPKIEVFPAATTTAAITCFRVGETASPIRVHAVTRLSQLDESNNTAIISREQMQTLPRWSIMTRPTSPVQIGTIELGELFHVHRGQVTGANNIWIAGEQARHLPDQVKLPTVTRARDLIEAGLHLHTNEALRRVIDLPPDLDIFTVSERDSINRFLRWARDRGADQGYVARHRRVWWSVGLRAPAPILCTYMARRPPQFTLNTCDARHINIAHGLYLREPLPINVLAQLVRWLNENIDTGSGRTYAGGLTKFEPKEIERLRIPNLEFLTDDMSPAPLDF